MPPPWGEPAPRSEDSESGVPTRELSTKLEPNLLRGVPLHVALTGWGRHWKNSENGMFTLERGPQGEAKRYELSYPTASLDAFLSHDWASNARLKVLSLVIIYNSRAAFLSCLAVSILVGVLRAEGLLPSEIWMATFGHLSFFLVLALWQRIRMLFCRPQLVFLDKLCISQQDEQLKQAGILGIAGFLMASRKLIVLWSPRTFLRVWCGFEIGTFLRDRQRRIQIMPLKTGSLLLLGSLCWHVLSLCFHVFSKSEDALLDFKVNFNVLALVSALMTLVFALVLPLVYAIGIELMRELAGLPQQLAQFRMQDATCFCCSNGHAHPQTGAPIPCDRQLVFKLLHKWYGRDEDGAEFMSEDALESFNVMVRKQLAPRVVSGLGASMLPLPYTVYMVGSCCLPYLSLYIPLWLEAGFSGFELFAKSIRLFLDWAIVGVASVFFTRLSLLLWRVGLSLQRCEAWGKGAVVAVLVLTGVALLLLVWIPFELSMFATSETSLLPLLPFLGALVATFGVFSLGGLQQTEEHEHCCPPGDIVDRQDSEGSTFQI